MLNVVAICAMALGFGTTSANAKVHRAALEKRVMDVRAVLRGEVDRSTLDGPGDDHKQLAQYWGNWPNWNNWNNWPNWGNWLNWFNR